MCYMPFKMMNIPISVKLGYEVVMPSDFHSKIDSRKNLCVLSLFGPTPRQVGRLRHGWWVTHLCLRQHPWLSILCSLYNMEKYPHT